jgi:hypothetical protein
MRNLRVFFACFAILLKCTEYRKGRDGFAKNAEISFANFAFFFVYFAILTKVKNISKGR